MQPDSWLQNTQSPLDRSRKLTLPCDRRAYMAVTSSTGSPRNAAMAANSSGVTQTKPGAPVQQCPQRVQVKRSPSSYHGSAIPSLSQACRRLSPAPVAATFPA